jgi:hypothetical protein
VNREGSIWKRRIKHETDSQESPLALLDFERRECNLILNPAQHLVAQAVADANACLVRPQILQ